MEITEFLNGPLFMKFFLGGAILPPSIANSILMLLYRKKPILMKKMKRAFALCNICTVGMFILLLFLSYSENLMLLLAFSIFVTALYTVLVIWAFVIYFKQNKMLDKSV